MRKLTSSLRFRLIVLILLAVLPMLGLTLYNNLEQRRAAAQETQEEALRLAQLMQDQLIENTRQLLAALAQLPEIRSGDPAACQALLADFLAQYPMYAALSAATPGGDVWCSAPPPSQPVNVADRSWFQRLLQTKDFVVGEYQLGRISGRSTLALAQPVLDETGDLQGSLAAGLDLTWVNRWAGEAQLPPGARFSVIDRNGTILARYPDAEGWVGRAVPEAPIIQIVLAQHRGVTEARGADGVQRLYAFSPLSSQREADVGVYLYIGIPPEIAFAEADRALGRSLALLGLVTGLAVIAAWLAADRFVLRQTRALLGATQRLAAGDLDARTGFAYRQGELGQLALAFDRMAETLKQRDAERKQAEQELAKARDRLASTLNSITDGYYALDAEWRFVAANRLAEEHFSRPASELLGQNIWNVTGTLPASFLYQHFSAAREERRPAHFEAQSGVQAGYWAELHVYPREDALEVYFRDISERKQAEAERERLLRQLEVERALLQAIIQNAPEGITVIDAAGGVMLSNPAADLLFTPPAPHAGAAQATWCYPDGTPYAQRELPLMRAALYGETHRDVEMALVWPDGQRRALLVNIAPIRDSQGEITGAVRVFQDITQRKETEVSLARQAEELARSNKELELFAYVASHDLQEPLRMVGSYVDLLAKRYQGQLDEQADLYIGFAVDGAHRMKRLIEDLLTYSRVGAQGESPVPTDSQAVLEEALARLQMTIEDKQATLTRDALPTVLADPVQLGQVFQNLIGNALKFSHEAPPRIHVGVQPDVERRMWRFCVVDNGIGLDPKFAERIFAIFQRLHGPTEYPGTGLGLAICKKIVERHGGRIWVESQPGQGATFYFTMPGV
jgi:PAS domain S-box-containing protein